ncbi:MAG: PD-(D/E)XK nuclease family transposase, partial [Oscillospiraceae bacterium]|nr:PD-(D/E)XK nuclease family transposase [Oscillospiraceae bacterium]
MERKHREDLERLRKFRLMDDDFMTKCFEGEPACIELVLRIVLDMAEIRVVEVHTQVFVENLFNRSLRLDNLAMDAEGKRFNVEIQRSDHGAGKQRARYNSSMMDVNALKKSGDFSALPETWVIFITENDVMGKNLPLYHIERVISETGELFR